MEFYKLNQVNDYISQVISLNFQESIWIDAEVSQVKEVRGQVYIEFVQKSEDKDDVVAKAQGVIWYKSLLFIRKKLGEILDALLQEGRQIRFKAKVEFHIVYGLKLSLEDIDPSFTLGTMEIMRQKTIAKLKEEQLLYKNQSTELPLVVKKIAVLSSSKAAGLQDFIHHITNNPFGYKYATTLFETSMQGSGVEKEVIQNLKIINDNQCDFECVVIIRGGGSKMDLSYFDSYDISATVAEFPLPVLTGIGHDIDKNVIELVAFKALKTPTAVADFLVHHNATFESQISEFYTFILKASSSAIMRKRSELENTKMYIQNQSVQYLKDRTYNLDITTLNIKNLVQKNILKYEAKVDQLSNTIQNLDPKQLINIGYSLTTQEGKILKKLEDVDKGKILITHLVDGNVESNIFKITENNELR